MDMLGTALVAGKRLEMMLTMALMGAVFAAYRFLMSMMCPKRREESL